MVVGFPRAHDVCSLRFLASLTVLGIGCISWSRPDLKSNRKVVGYSHDICATIGPVHLAGMSPV